ncbi:hypothetical protein [Nocardioides sp. SYSU DS0651]|uniref:hypothetical protein n=1 Tax=Nocardioides sp. SYSU DS0651 TaxID=3415955 RepID=UPI003F4C3E2D
MHVRRSAQLLLAAALAAPALLTACGEGPAVPAAAGSVPDGVSAEHLLTDDDTVYVEGAADWFATSTWTRAGQELFGPCAMTGLADTGATSVAGREFELRNLEPDAPAVRGDRLTQVVAEYPSEAAAIRAWSTVNGWLEECTGRPDELTDYRALQTRKVPVPEADAVVTDSHFGPLPAELRDGDATHLMETGVLRVGDRLTVVTSVVVGSDYDFIGGTPVERMLVPAAERLSR